MGERERPNILFKYFRFDEYSKRIFTARELYFPSPKRFNDPLDCRLVPSLDADKSTWWNWFLTRSQREKHNVTFSQISGVFERNWRAGHDSPQRLVELAEATIPKAMESKGVLCLSENRNNNVMFSHYADNHRGFCLGIDFSRVHDLIGRVEPSGKVTRMFYKVNYISEILTPPNFFENEDYPRWIIETKHQDWSYEREWRVIDYDGERANRVEDDVVKEVILGCEMLDSDREAIHRMIGQSGLKPRVLQAIKSKRKLSLDLIEMRI